MRGRPVPVSALLIVGTIAVGITMRLAHLGLPHIIVKYAGSMLWALMVYWIVTSLRPRWPLIHSILGSIIVAFAVELFKLYHTPPLDAFRLTLPGTLLLGRVFSLWDLVAYACAIAIAAWADRAIWPGTR